MLCLVGENPIKRVDDFLAARGFRRHRIAHAEHSLHRCNPRSLNFLYSVRNEKHLTSMVTERFSDFRIAPALRFCSDSRVKETANVFRQIARGRTSKKQL